MQPHSISRDLAERWLGEDGDLSSDEITLLAKAHVSLFEQLEAAEARWQELEHPFDKSEFDRLHEQLEALQGNVYLFGIGEITREQLLGLAPNPASEPS